MQPWGPPRVRLELPPQHGVHLLAWGADPGGAWWALVTWERYIAHHFEAPQQLWCTAWAPAAAVQRLEHEDYSRVPRLRKRAILHRMQQLRSASLAAYSAPRWDDLPRQSTPAGQTRCIHVVSATTQT